MLFLFWFFIFDLHKQRGVLIRGYAICAQSRMRDPSTNNKNKRYRAEEGADLLGDGMAFSTSCAPEPIRSGNALKRRSASIG